MRYMKRVLLIIGISTAAFTVTMIVIYIIKDDLPDILVQWFYKIVAGEAGITCLIKVVESITGTIAKRKKISSCDIVSTDDDVENDAVG